MIKKFLITIPLFFILPVSSFALTIDNIIEHIGTSEPPLVDVDVYFSCNDINNTVEIYPNGEETNHDNFLCNETSPRWSAVQIGITYFVETTGSCLDNTYPNILSDSCFVDVVSSNYSLPTTPKSGVLFGRSGESQTAIQSGGGVLAAVGLVSTNAFSGIFPYLMLSVGVFIGFYIIQQIVMFLGMRSEKVKVDKEQAEWSGQGKMDHEVNEFKKKRRSKIKRGLE
jgi:hypothetical protein